MSEQLRRRVTVLVHTPTLRRGNHFRQRCSAALTQASVQGSTELITRLLGVGASWRDARGAFHAVLDRGEPGLARLALRTGADVHTNMVNTESSLSCSVLVYVLASDMDACVEMTRVLIEYGADVGAPSSVKKTPLHMACSSRFSSELVPLLVQKGARVNVYDDEGWTPLGKSIMLRKPVAARCLVRAGARLERSCCDKDYTPLALACRLGNVQFVDMMIVLGADPSATTARGDSPLSVAKGPDVVARLLAGGADPKARKALLHIIAARSCAEIVPPGALVDCIIICQLCMAGADPTAISRGDTPARVARASGNHRKAVLLERAERRHRDLAEITSRPRQHMIQSASA